MGSRYRYFIKSCFYYTFIFLLGYTIITESSRDVRAELNLLRQEAGEEDRGEFEQADPLLQSGDRETAQTVQVDSGLLSGSQDGTDGQEGLQAVPPRELQHDRRHSLGQDLQIFQHD